MRKTIRTTIFIATLTTLLLLSSCSEEDWIKAICSGDTSDLSWTEYLTMKAYCFGKGVATDAAESAVDYKATKDKASGFGFTECGGDKDYYIAGTCMTEAEFDAYFYASATYSGKGGCKHPTPFHITDGAFGERCVNDIDMRNYLEQSGVLTNTGTTAPATSTPSTTTPPDPECKTNTDCPSYCRGTSTVVSQTCSSGTCVDTGTRDCTQGGQYKYTTCTDTGAGAACSQQKQCQVSSDCGDGRVSVCASEGGPTKYTYNCNAQFACETFIVNCPADFGAGSVCRSGGCTNP